MSVFVTCLYDIASFEQNSSRKSAAFYLQYASFLKNLQHPIIIFTSAELKSQLTESFQDAPLATIIIRPFEEFLFFDRLAEMNAISQVNPYRTRSPLKDTSLFKVLMWNKSEFIGIIAQQFPQYDVFIWIDFGLEVVVKKYIDATNVADVVSKFDDTHFCCTVLNPLSAHEYYNLHICFEGWRFRQVGGFWAIGRKNVDFFVNFIREEINQLFREKFICTEEDLMARFVFAHSDKCKLSFGDYETCMINWSGLLRQVQYIPSVLCKLQNNHQHRLAIFGFEGLLDAHMKGELPMSIDNFFGLFYYYFISMFYVDRQKSKEVAVQMLRIALVHTRFRELLIHTKSADFRNLQHVLTKDELDVLSPTGYNNQPFFKTMLSRVSRPHLAIGDPNIFQPIDLYNILVI